MVRCAPLLGAVKCFDARPHGDSADDGVALLRLRLGQSCTEAPGNPTPPASPVLLRFRMTRRSHVERLSLLADGGNKLVALLIPSLGAARFGAVVKPRVYPRHQGRE